VDGPEEVLLVAEVVVERAARQPGPLHDVLGPCASEALLGEELAGSIEQGAPRVSHVGIPEARLSHRVSRQARLDQSLDT
jgi:hypothetical protein